MHGATYWHSGFYVDFFGYLCLPVDVDGNNFIQELLLDIRVIYKTGDAFGPHQQLQLVPVCVKEPLQRTEHENELSCMRGHVKLVRKCFSEICQTLMPRSLNMTVCSFFIVLVPVNMTDLSRPFKVTATCLTPSSDCTLQRSNFIRWTGFFTCRVATNT